MRGLGLLPYSNCVHYDAEPERRAEYHRFVADGMRPGFAAEDGVALHFRGTDLARVVSSRRDGAAFLVEHDGKRVRETRLEVDFLGGASVLPSSSPVVAPELDEPPAVTHAAGDGPPALSTRQAVAA